MKYLKINLNLKYIGTTNDKYYSRLVAKSLHFNTNCDIIIKDTLENNLYYINKWAHIPNGNGNNCGQKNNIKGDKNEEGYGGLQRLQG